MRNFGYKRNAMKLLLVNGSRLRFTVETPAAEPLGGTESACAWLARALAARGHDTSLMAHLPEGAAEQIAGVHHVPIAAAQDAGFFAKSHFDVVITLSAPQAAQLMKQMAPDALHVAWLHLPPSPAVRDLINKHRPFMEWAVFVSQTQAQAVGYTGPSHVIGNGIAPVFENLFASAAELLAAKQNRAAYASVPDRGLDVLADVMAQTKLETEFDIYSGMRLYQESEDSFAPLYARSKALPRCHYHGALGQTALAEALKPAAFLAYPCTVGETYGIVVQEAIAAGLKVVTTDLGHLRHTTMGFADLVTPGPGLAARFTTQLEQTVGQFLTDPRSWAEERFAQARAVNRDCSWAVRAKEWEDFLGRAMAAR
jgi:glycosyltransferase involved in cell wall biosynthesis